MADFEKKGRWNRWAGHVTDLVAAGREAASAIEEWAEEEGGEAKVRLTIVLKDVTTRDESLDALEGMDVRDFPLVESVYIDAGVISPSASIRVDNSAPAVSYEVRGADRLRVEGLASRLDGLLNRGRTHAAWYQRAVAVPLAALLMILFVLGGVGVLRSLGLAGDDGELTQAERIALPVIFGLPAVVGFTLWWLLPGPSVITARRAKPIPPIPGLGRGRCSCRCCFPRRLAHLGCGERRLRVALGGRAMVSDKLELRALQASFVALLFVASALAIALLFALDGNFPPEWAR